MASEKIPLSYKGHPLRRKDNLIYYGTMAEKYIIMLRSWPPRRWTTWTWPPRSAFSCSSPTPI